MARKRIKQLNMFTSDDSLPCLACAAEDHWLCYKPMVNKCCCADMMQEQKVVEQEFAGLLTGNKQTRSKKDATDVTDVQSTGRKRAAVMYPIEEGMVCEWSHLKFAGGGVVPIIGCLDNPATDRHHGPDKNTLNNTEGNVHRICAFCHNWWHAKNDEFYGERPNGTEPFIPLDGNQWRVHDRETKAELKEIITAQLGRKQPKKEKVSSQ